MAKAKSTDPVKVAKALEGLKVKSFAGDVEMRKSDHQLQQALFITKWQKADAKNPYSVENTGLHLRAGQADGPVRVQHAHQLPDEASRRRVLSAPRPRSG